MDRLNSASAVASRRMSQGNFAIVEDEDYSKAMSRLERAAGLASATPPAGDGGGAYSASASASAPAPASASSAAGVGASSYYWRAGPAVDVSALLRGGRAVHRPRRRSALADEGALSDPNPPPALVSLAEPPPHAIMHPEGNSVVNSRIERCLARNGVALAQTVEATRGALAALLKDETFRAASLAVGFDPYELAAGTEGGGGGADGEPRGGGAEEQTGVSHLKHLALVLTEYQDMRLAGRAAARQPAAGASALSPGGAGGAGAGGSARRARSRDGGGPGGSPGGGGGGGGGGAHRGGARAAGGRARAALDARAASLADLGLLAHGGRAGGAPAPPPASAFAPHASVASYGSWADAASAGAPADEAAEGGGGGGGGLGAREGEGGGREDDEAEAAELGLSVEQVAAVRGARSAARAALGELEAAHAAIRDAARATVGEAPRRL